MKRLQLFVLSALILLTQFTFTQQTIIFPKNKFYIGSQGGGLFIEYYDAMMGTLSSGYYSHYRTLSFNTTVDYGTDYDYQSFESWMPANGRVYGGFYDTLNSPPGIFPFPVQQGYVPLPTGYRQILSNSLYSWQNTVNPADIGTVFLRSSKIDRSAMGQRSDYQAEQYDQFGVQWISKTPGYGYSTRQIGNPYSEVWKGESVRGQVCRINEEGQD